MRIGSSGVFDTGVTWPGGTAPSLVTALPASPTDGQQIFFQADATNGIYWHFRYRSGSASTYKWEYLGGPPLIHQVDASITITSTSYVAGTGGPTLTIPLAGDYDIETACYAYAAINGSWQRSSYAVGATAAVDADGTVHEMETVGTAANLRPKHMRRVRRKTGIAASTVIEHRYRGSSTGNNIFSLRELIITPVRVG